MTRLRIVVALTLTLMLVAVLAAACKQATESSGKTVQVSKPAEEGAAPAPPSAPAPETPVIGKPMPQFEFTALDGKTDSLSNHLGRPLLVNLWGTRCDPCVAEMPDLVEFYRAHQDDGVEIIGLAVDDTAEDVKRFLETREMPWVLGLDSGDVYRRWALRGIPTTYFIDREGVVVNVRLGGMSREMMESFAAPLFE